MTESPDTKIPPQYRQVVEEFRQKALEKFHECIKSMILYGSVARGDANDESDIDLLIVWDGERSEAFHELGKITCEILLNYAQVISLHPMTPEHYQSLLELDTLFIQNVMRDGIVLAG